MSCVKAQSGCFWSGLSMPWPLFGPVQLGTILDHLSELLLMHLGQSHPA